MKILMIPSWYPTEQAPLLGTFYKEQAEMLAAGGASVAVAYVNVDGDMNWNHHGVRAFTENGVATYIDTHPNFTPRMEAGRRWQRTRMLKKLYQRILREWGRPDVVNLRSSLQGYEAMALCAQEDLPLFFMEHSSYVMTEPADSPMLERLRAVMQQADVCACVSSAVRRVMQPIKDTRVIPDCLDDRRFYPVEVRREEGEADAFVFRSMGQLRPIKGFDVLIKAFALLQKRTDRPVRLDIAGTGGLREMLEQLMAEQGVQESCRLVGAVPRDRVLYFMNGCDCFVCSSRTETLSCVLNEAAACGKPLISTRCGGPEDIVTGLNGLLVPPEDPEALAQAMQVMLDKVDTYDPEAIREATLERFGVDTVRDLLLDACADAVRLHQQKSGRDT